MTSEVKETERSAIVYLMLTINSLMEVYEIDFKTALDWIRKDVERSHKNTTS